MCPGFCMQPSLLFVATFVLVMCLFAAVGSFVPEVQDRLLEAGAASSAAAVDGRSSLRHAVTAAELHVVARAGCSGMQRGKDTKLEDLRRVRQRALT